MTPFHPLVSIVIPVYNGANFLKEAIDSALAQTYDNYEVLVINDGSTDNGATEEIALSYGDKIRYFHKTNGGVATALNMGIDEMRGEYFSWLSHDDVYLPHKIASQIAFLEQLGEKDAIVYGDVFYIDSSGQVIGKMEAKNVPPQYMFWNHYTFGGLHGCALLLSRICLQHLNGFDVRLSTTQDFDLWFRMLLEYTFYKQSEPVLLSRVHSEQGSLTTPAHISAQKKLYLQYLPAAINLWKKHLYFPPSKHPVHTLAYLLRLQGSAFGFIHFIHATTIILKDLGTMQRIALAPHLLFPCIVSCAYHLPANVKQAIRTLKEKYCKLIWA